MPKFIGISPKHLISRLEWTCTMTRCNDPKCPLNRHGVPHELHDVIENKPERFNGELGDVLKGVRGIKKCDPRCPMNKPHLGDCCNGPPWRTLIACAAVHEPDVAK